MILTKNEVEIKLKDSREINPDDAFLVLQSMCFLANKDPEDNEMQQLLLRVLDRKEEFSPFIEVVNGLIRHFGLYPYLDTNTITVKDAIAREIHRPSLLANDDNNKNIEDEGFVFHRVQAEVFQYLMDGENIILSAPTSFGKSALIDSLIESKKFDNIIIIVPTIALIDETRRRISGLKCDHKIITHASQELQSKNIFILTQERTIDFPNLPNFDIFILDEFYKLDPREDSERAMTLNHALYKLHKKSKQFYLLGPNIQNIPEGLPDRLQCKFIRTNYSTVVTELIRVGSNKDSFYDELLSLCNSIQGSTLIFCSSPNKARIITELLANHCTQIGEGLADAADWVAENYHPDWTLVNGLRKGIGMHHGQIPRAIAHLCVKGFNEGKLPFLVCTSTLIEGVNTKAKNVIIFDNKIANKKFDFFTFNNIRGRSGRMFQYFIGPVYLFNDPPQEKLPLVEIPVFSQEENAEESLLIQLDKMDITKESLKRIQKYYDQDILDISVLRSNSGINPDLQINFANYLIVNWRELSILAWKSIPTYDQLEHLCCLIWKYLLKGKKFHKVSSGRQLAFKINQLRNNEIKEIISNEIFQGKEPNEAVENTLSFIRQWAQFHFPRLAMAVCRIQNAVAERLGVSQADYSFFFGQVESLFTDSALVALDEYGLPLPLAEKLENMLNSNGSLDTALKNLSILNFDKLSLTIFEKEMLNDVKKSI